MVPVPCVRYETAPLVQTGFWDIETAAARSNMHTAPSCSKPRFQGATAKFGLVEFYKR